MRKLITLFFLLLAVVIHAQQITPDEAAAIASEFLNSSSTQLAKSRRVGMKRAKAQTDADDNSLRPYYVFNAEDNQGFVIVSGDKRAKKILGYSNAGAFNFDNLPPALERMLNQYEKEIAALPASITEMREGGISPTRTVIEPLLTTKWGQGEPYNNSCPVISGEHTLTGCVATAFAQVMNYHKWPKCGRGSHSYYNYWSGDTYSIDFSQVEFDWDAMLDMYDSYSNERSKDAVATLMKACGYSINMQYDIQASGAPSDTIPYAAHKFFDYSSRAFCASREDYTSEQWETIIYAQLSKGLPVIYSGSNDVGHCFVCDGYDGEGFYHFNWGWSGEYDGYFLLSALNPGYIEFNMNQNCILNFYPSIRDSDFSISDGTFVYTELGKGNLALVGVADSDNKLSGDVVLPNETMINGTRYTVTSILCSFSDILDFENLTSLDIQIPVISIPRLAFSGCSSLTSIELPLSVTSLGAACFAGCSSLTSIEIPSSVTSLEIYSFRGCSSLTSITIPSSVTSLGDECFEGCSSLASIELPATATSLGAACFAWCSSLTSIELPSSVTSLDGSCFEGCSSLTSIEIPSSVTNLGNYCFYGCSSLVSIEIPSSVTSLGVGCFYGCKALTSIEISSSVTNLGNYCFYGCSSLVSIEIPSSVTSLGVGCFNGCKALTSIEIPSSVTSLGDACFAGCLSLTSINLPPSATSLGKSCFLACSSLTSIKIPSSVTSLGNQCFNGCNLTSVVSEIEEPFELASGTFDNSFSICTLTVPRGKREAYMVAGWTEDIFRGGIVEAPYNLASDNYLILSDIEVGKGCSVVLPVNMHNSEAVTALQFELSLPVGVTLSDCFLTGRRGADHVVSYNRLPNANYQVVIISQTKQNFLGSEGVLLKLSLDVDGGVPSGDYPMLVKNIELTTSDTQVVNPTDVRAMLMVSDVKLGDSNANGTVNIADAVNTANYAVGIEVERFCFEAADVNADQRITLSDASGTVTLLLEQPVEEATPIQFEAPNRLSPDVRDRLVVDDYAAVTGRNSSVSVSLDNTVGYVALQADVTVPEGMTFSEVKLGRRSAASHSLMTRRVDGRTMRIALFCPNNARFADNNEPLLELVVNADNAQSGDIEINNIIAADAKAHEYALQSVGGHFLGTTGIATANSDGVWVGTANKTIRIRNAQGCEITIYSVGGQTVAHFTAASELESRSVGTGFYIVAVGKETFTVIIK